VKSRSEGKHEWEESKQQATRRRSGAHETCKGEDGMVTGRPFMVAAVYLSFLFTSFPFSSSLFISFASSFFAFVPCSLRLCIHPC
jgi:hypothetical protein